MKWIAEHLYEFGLQSFDLKNVNSSAVFRKMIKEWNGDKCNCKICR